MNKEKLLEIRKLLRLRMNGEVSTAMRKKGLNYKINFGLDAMSLRGIAKSYTPEISLAEDLWKESSREGKILATMLYPNDLFTEEKADTWISECTIFELAEQLTFNLLQHQNYAPDKAIEWIFCDDEHIKSCGYLLLLRLILSKKEVKELDKALLQAEKDKLSDHYQLSLQANKLLERYSI